ncbi:uncharacterized protein LOC100277811 [Zea mays]|uniref:Uncharacterized protein n=1 Tax=Zea mays TaxID=4577 RepID=B6U072_MAIZE|nr:uncharacterized protein LOC100277811 [Zea mays]ACG42755.1 hypothetical protein [Zea mays]|eukprot:NP_001315975.1 uncharacterized protein LOC100277811 [Zea mays]
MLRFPFLTGLLRFANTKISNAEFTFSPWTPFPTKRLLPRILNPNPRRSAS